MSFFRCKKITALIIACCLFSLTFDASAMVKGNDFLSLSWPGQPVNHTINFQTNDYIPPSGRIVITPQPGMFTIMPGFDYNDVDFSTSTSANGVFGDRILDIVPSAAADSVNVNFFAMPPNIQITLNSTEGISTGTFIKIELGLNATYQAIGDTQILNPNTVGTYTLEFASYDNAGNFIERKQVAVAIIQPVITSAQREKMRFNGTPFDVLDYGTTETILSMMTNYLATCRYGTSPGVQYLLQPNIFTHTGNYYHSILLTGLGNGGTYTYYVRCRDINNVDDDTDFIITFSVDSEAIGEEGGTPGPGGGGSGGGGGGGSGSGQGTGVGPYKPYPPEPGTPTISLQGWSYSSSPLTLLRDGKEEKKITSGADGAFKIDVYDLPQGTYTFGLSAEDTEKRKSVTQSYTVYIKEATTNQINGIVIPPTMQIDKNNITEGGIITAFGRSTPNASVEVWLYPSKTGTIKDSEIVKTKVAVAANGSWTAGINTAGLSKGAYKIKAMTTKDILQSQFSQIYDVGIGVKVTTNVCQGADLNKDGKVNITDFSILLYWWTTDNECADQNKDKVVNIVDFSIMMYYWTG